MKKYAMILAVCSFVTAANGQHSLALDESKYYALHNNAKTKNSVLEMDASRQTRKAAFTKFFPDVSAAGAMFGAEKNLMELSMKGGDLPVYNGDPALLSAATQFAYFPSSTAGLLKKGTLGMVTAVQPVFAGGRIVKGNQLASLGEDVSEYKNHLAINEVIFKTEELYWQVVSLDDKLKTIAKYERLLDRLLAQVTDAYASGIVMKNDLLKVQLKKSEVLLNRSKLENGRSLAAMAFCQHIGIPHDAAIICKDSLAVDGPPQSLFVDHEAALMNRSEFKLLEASVRAEELQTAMKLGEYLPQAAVGVSGVYMKFDDSGDRRIGMVYGTVQIPISGWWGASHTLQERGIKEEMSRNVMKDNSELLLLQMEKSRQDVTDAYKQVLLSEEAKLQAEENVKLNEDSYTNGLTTVADLLDAQAELQHTDDGLTDAKAKYRIDQVFYRQVTGR